jgi:serine/threonine-protein kinase
LDKLSQTQQMRDPLVGTLFGGHYKIERLVARGNMSVVYQATNTNDNSTVAVKLLNGCLITDRDSMRRFQREAQIARSMMHPNVCALLDHGVTGEGTPYHVLEFISGETLEDILSAITRLNPVESLAIFDKICRAIQYLHSRGVVHRDIKPGNVMIPTSDTTTLPVKIIDFGVAKGTRKGVHDQVDLTRPGEVFGSLLYTAPERFMGQAADERSDVYSLGCLMYEVLTGVNPFTADTPSEIVQKQLKAEPEPLVNTGLQPDIAQLLQPVIGKALAKDPADRFQTVAELRAALEPLHTPVKMAYIRSDPQRTTRSHPRQKTTAEIFWRAAGIALFWIAGVVGLAVVVLVFWRAHQSGVGLPFGW